MYDLEEFKEKCNSTYCPRSPRVKPKSCKNPRKQERCYSKYKKVQERQLEKAFEVDEEWEDVRAFVWERDKGECQLWKILTKEERLYILKNYIEEYGMLSQLDCAHIIGKGTQPKLKYLTSNVVLVKRFFHSLLDSQRCPVTQKTIDSKTREQWFQDAYNNKRTVVRDGKL